VADVSVPHTRLRRGLSGRRRAELPGLPDGKRRERRYGLRCADAITDLPEYPSRGGQRHARRPCVRPWRPQARSGQRTAGIASWNIISASFRQVSLPLKYANRGRCQRV